ncbi:MAG: acyl-CoA dehydrogenase family protein [Pirellulales bacterium]
MMPPCHPHAAGVPDAALHALSEQAARTAREGPWASGSFAALARHGFLAAFVPAAHGGTAAAEPEIVAALVAIAERCLTTALALTQWAAAVRIIAGGPPRVAASLLPALARGDTFTTVGISQLTTSHLHLARPALLASRLDDEWWLDGLCPWVTGADACDTIVTGAAIAGGGQAFFVVATDAPGVTIEPPLDMLALSGSRTSIVRLGGVRPAHVIEQPASAARTGGLSTSALAIGASRAGIAAIAGEAARRPGLAAAAAGFEAETDDLFQRLLTAARDGIEPADRDRLRADANGLVVRVAQAALTAAKGAGFVVGHPVERLVRESLFFLVWSCPQAVADAVLCDLVGP